MSKRKANDLGKLVNFGTADNPAALSPDGLIGQYAKADGSLALANNKAEVGGLGPLGPYAFLNSANRYNSIVLAKSFAAVSGAADTNENTLATVTIPAGMLRTDGGLLIMAAFSNNNNGNNKTFRVRLGGVSGTVLASQVNTTGVLAQMQILLGNRGAANSQFAMASVGVAAAVANSTVTASIDTSAATTLVFTAQKATGGDTATLDAYAVELFR